MPGGKGIGTKPQAPIQVSLGGADWTPATEPRTSAAAKMKLTNYHFPRLPAYSLGWDFHLPAETAQAVLKRGKWAQKASPTDEIGARQPKKVWFFRRFRLTTKDLADSLFGSRRVQPLGCVP